MKLKLTHKEVNLLAIFVMGDLPGQTWRFAETRSPDQKESALRFHKTAKKLAKKVQSFLTKAKRATKAKRT